MASNSRAMLLFLLLAGLPLALPHRRDGIPRHLHDKLKKAHSFLDVVDGIHVIYHPEKTNSHIEKTFPTSAPRSEVRIVSGSFMPSRGKKLNSHRRLSNSPSAVMMSDSAPNTPQPLALHDDVDHHTADQLSLFGSIKQGNDTCQLQSVCVPVPIETDDPQIVIFPKCYEVMQCVGSCCEAFESCHPHSIRKVQKPIVELIYVGNDRFMLNKTMNITMEEHLSCSCLDCGPDAPTCDDGFVLGPSCECECVNKGDSNNCRGRRRWDDVKCTCTCDPATVSCGPGQYLDRQKCECTSSQDEINPPTAPPPPTTERGREIDIASLPRLKANVLSKYP